MLELKAAELRLKIVETAAKTGKGHVAGSLSCVDILTSLFYGSVIRYNPKNPQWPERDRFILSKGHAALAYYAVLADLGFFPVETLNNFEGDGSMLAGHPDQGIPGVEIVTGSLGHGLGIAAGMALAAKLDSRSWRVFCLLSDGECQEGSTWEAAMFASHHNLNNITAVIDRNGLQASDFTEDTLKLEPLRERWEAFGWTTANVDGHSMNQLLEAFSFAKKNSAEFPQVIIARTIKGKGVSFMQSSPLWHNRVPRGEEVGTALGELRQRITQLRTQGAST